MFSTVPPALCGKMPPPELQLALVLQDCSINCAAPRFFPYRRTRNTLCVCCTGRPKRQAAPKTFQNEEQQGADHIDIESPVAMDHRARPAQRQAHSSQLQQPSQLTIPAAHQAGCSQASPVDSPYNDFGFASDDEAGQGPSKPQGKTPQLGGLQGRQAPASARSRGKATSTGRAGAKAAADRPAGGNNAQKGKPGASNVSCVDSAALAAKIANAAKPPLPMRSGIVASRTRAAPANSAAQSAGVMPAAAAAQHALLPAQVTPEAAPAASHASMVAAQPAVWPHGSAGGNRAPGLDQNDFAAFMANMMQGAQGNGAALQEAGQMFQQMFANFATGTNAANNAAAGSGAPGRAPLGFQAPGDGGAVRCAFFRAGYRCSVAALHPAR